MVHVHRRGFLGVTAAAGAAAVSELIPPSISARGQEKDPVPAPKRERERFEMVKDFTAVAAGVRMHVAGLDALRSKMSDADRATYDGARKSVLEKLSLEETAVVAQLGVAMGKRPADASGKTFEELVQASVKSLAESSADLIAIEINLEKRLLPKPRKDEPPKDPEKKPTEKEIVIRLVTETSFDRMLREGGYYDMALKFLDKVLAKGEKDSVFSVCGDVFGTFPPTMRKEWPGLWETIAREKTAGGQGKNFPEYLTYLQLLRTEILTATTRAVISETDTLATKLKDADWDGRKKTIQTRVNDVSTKVRSISEEALAGKRPDAHRAIDAESLGIQRALLDAKTYRDTLKSK